MKKLLFIIAMLLLYSTAKSQSTTPPARTWYVEKSQKTSVKERWNEDSQGLKHGVYISYFEDGDREMYGNYVHGKLNGQVIITSRPAFNDGIETITYVNYKNGVLDGLYKEETKQGNILTKGVCVNGKKEGYWQEYEHYLYKKGTIKGNYINGQRNGEWLNTYVDTRTYEPAKKGDYSLDKDNFTIRFKQGYKTIFNKDIIVAIYDEKGVDIEEIEKQKNIAELNNNIKKEFLKCVSIEDYQYFIKKYPNDENTPKAKEIINEYEKESAFISPLLEKWGNLSPEEKESNYSTLFGDYFKKYPKGNFNKLLADSYNSNHEEILKNKRHKDDLDKCGNDVLCIYQYTNTDLSSEAKGKIKTLLNNINSKSEASSNFKSDCSHDLSLFQIALEIKEKYGYNIFCFMNKEGYYNSFLDLIKNHPNNDGVKDYFKLHSKSYLVSFDIKIKNNKLVKMVIEDNSWLSYQGDDKTLLYTMEFDDEGNLETYKYKKTITKKSAYTSSPEVFHTKFTFKFNKQGEIVSTDAPNYETCLLDFRK